MAEEREYWRVVESEEASTIDGSSSSDDQGSDSVHGGESINELSMCDPHSPLYGKTMLDFQRLKSGSVGSSIRSKHQKWVSSISIDPPEKGQQLTLTEVSAVTLNVDQGQVTTIKDALPEFNHVTRSPNKVTYHTSMVSSNQKPSYNNNVSGTNQRPDNSERRFVDVNGNEYPSTNQKASPNAKRRKRKLNLQLRKETELSDDEVGTEGVGN